VGDIFLLQDERRLMRRERMEHADGKWHAVVSHRQLECRVELRDGLRAGFFDQRERYARRFSDPEITLSLARRALEAFCDKWVSLKIGRLDLGLRVPANTAMVHA
jgi:hypothetical protein